MRPSWFYGIDNSRNYGMRSTMDSAGRLVIPRQVRRQAGWAPGVPLDVRWRDGRVEIEPAPVAVRLERRGHLLVAVPREPISPLTATEVERTRDALQQQRDATVLLERRVAASEALAEAARVSAASQASAAVSRRDALAAGDASAAHAAVDTMWAAFNALHRHLQVANTVWNELAPVVAGD